MNKTIKLQFASLMACASIALCVQSAEAQTDYYHSPAYQAEEQAFRARQDEGARLHETFGEYSAPYFNWAQRERAIKGLGPSNPYQFGGGYPYQYGGANPYQMYTQQRYYKNSFVRGNPHRYNKHKHRYHR